MHDGTCILMIGKPRNRNAVFFQALARKFLGQYKICVMFYFANHNFEGLLKLQNSYNLTHIFIAQTEYEEISHKLQCVLYYCAAEIFSRCGPKHFSNARWR